MNGEPEAEFGPYAFALTPEESAAAAARFGLRRGLAGGLTTRHFAPLAAFVLILLFASILALTGLVSRRAGEIAILLAAMAFMLQRLATHLRLHQSRRKGKAALADAESLCIATIDAGGVTVSGGASPRRFRYRELEDAEDAGGLVFLWPKKGTPVVLPERVLGAGVPARLVAQIRRRILAAEAGARGPVAMDLLGRGLKK